MWQADLEELSIDYRKSGRKFKLGYSIRTWEGTDLINPMEIIHTKNYRDPLQARPLAAPGFFYDDSAGSFTWDFTYLAVQQKSKFPGTNSPWLPRDLYLPVEIENLIYQLPEDAQYEYLSSLERDNALSNNFALRLQYHGTHLGLSFAGFEGASTPPLLSPEIDGDVVDVRGGVTVVQGRTTIPVRPVYHRQRAAAVALNLTIGSWIFRASGNHIEPLGNAEQPRTPDWSQLGVLAIEKTFYLDSQMITLILQAAGSRKPKTSSLSLLSSLFEESYMVAVRYAPNEKWTWLQAFFQEQKFYSNFYHSELTWNFKSPWSLELHANFFQGSPISPIGNFGSNDQIILKTGYAF